MNKQEYNGWTNYETWNVKLWMDNDEGAYNYWLEQSQYILDHAVAERFFTKKEKAILQLSENIQGLHEENTPELKGVYADLLNAALSEVNWYEIAASMIDALITEKAATK